MQTEQSRLDKLFLFKQRDKFSRSAWNDRGLNPSSTELCGQLTVLFNSCADNLAKAINDKYSEKKIRAVLKAGIGSFNKLDYDTEEKEFIEIFGTLDGTMLMKTTKVTLFMLGVKIQVYHFLLKKDLK